AAAVARVLGERQRLQDQEQVEPEDDGHADEAPLLAEDGEDEGGVAGGEELQLRLRPLLEALSVNAAGADGDLGLRDLIAAPERVAVGVEEGDDAVLL